MIKNIMKLEQRCKYINRLIEQKTNSNITLVVIHGLYGDIVLLYGVLEGTFEGIPNVHTLCSYFWKCLAKTLLFMVTQLHANLSIKEQLFLKFLRLKPSLKRAEKLVTGITKDREIDVALRERIISGRLFIWQHHSQRIGYLVIIPEQLVK